MKRVRAALAPPMPENSPQTPALVPRRRLRQLGFPSIIALAKSLRLSASNSTATNPLHQHAMCAPFSRHQSRSGPNQNSISHDFASITSAHSFDAATSETKSKTSVAPAVSPTGTSQSAPPPKSHPARRRPYAGKYREAILTVHSYAVDVASGVESSPAKRPRQTPRLLAEVNRANQELCS